MGVIRMAKVIYEGLITDPKDPVYKEGWVVSIPCEKNRKVKENEKRNK
tara:strand:+ start:254 stop:397 length:144 start_codon:yes stop_codon:yes gene_type:complete